MRRAASRRRREMPTARRGQRAFSVLHQGESQRTEEPGASSAPLRVRRRTEREDDALERLGIRPRVVEVDDLDERLREARDVREAVATNAGARKARVVDGHWRARGCVVE